MVCASCGHESVVSFRFCPECGAPAAAPTQLREVRKTVTVLFCDLTGSTELGERTDPEALRTLLARYFERMKGIVERHGGSVEKFIGDAVMAVFGIPVVHEDDALRACRAAIEMRDALPELGLAGRIGVHTGEVVTGTEERLATGDAVNVAARLEQAAAAGEVLIGATTDALVRGAVEAEPLEPLALKGKSEPVPAFRLVEVLDAAERAHESRFVGRERELAELEATWERARVESRCELLTVLGDAGVGKSRLVAEALARIDARVARGRCLPYGDGITYWPVVEIVKQLAATPSDPAAAAAIRSMLGEGDRDAGADEIGWAFRKLLEEQAPLIVVFDDVQWGEETFLDLVEAASLLTPGVPLVLLCMARPELIERRPTWPAPMRLQPLAPEEADTLIGAAVSEGLRERIADASGGNPLFITEMLAMAGDGEVDVPPTLKALLAMRLDQLDANQRRVLECGAVEGEIFHRGAVQALASDQSQVTSQLATLVRRQLIRPDRAQLPGEDGFRFRHLLIRDAAYDALPKAVRADLHQRFAAWLGTHGPQLVELDEILGYHLEQAARYSAELGQDSRELAVAAGDRLAAAGRRAYWRGDLRTAAGLLERALALTRPHRLDVHLEVTLTGSLNWTDVAQALAIAEAAAERAAAAGDGADAALAETAAAVARFQSGHSSPDEVERCARGALPLLEAKDDDEGLVHVWNALAWVANMRQEYEGWTQATENGLLLARRSGQPLPGANTMMLAVPLALGPRPASEALASLDAVIAEQPYAGAVLLRAVLLAMLDRIDEAWEVALPASEHLREVGFAMVGEWLGELAVIAGDYERAATHLGEACGALEKSGNLGELSTYTAALGRALCKLGRYDEAEPHARRGRELGVSDDVMTQYLWRQAQALVHSGRGEHVEAELLARQAVEFSRRSDSSLYQGHALCDLAEVLEAAGRRDEAVAVLRKGLDCYERKQAIPLARRTRERLTALDAGS
jgi:class 3 adenylate cyclase/tetratricopeptide (TPR) repeat protein